MNCRMAMPIIMTPKPTITRTSIHPERPWSGVLNGNTREE